MRYLTVLMLVCVFVVGCSRKEDSPPVFSVPDGVTYEYKPNDKVHSFKLSEGDDSDFFILYPMKPGSSGIRIDNISNKTEDEIIQIFHDSKSNTSSDDTKSSDVAETLEKMLNDKSGITRRSSLTVSSTFSAGKFSGMFTKNKVVFSDGKIVYEGMYWLPGRKQTWAGILKTSKETDVEIVRQILESSK